MNAKIRNAVAVATLSLAAVAGAAGVAQADASDNHHEFTSTVDCRNSSYGAAAVLSPTYHYGPQDNTRQCGATDQAAHQSLTSLLGLANVT
ncbi:hypothetical protein ABZ626_09275 [Streptomyces longispororuber]|uniref:hypothetical protein n=1 Tax=Streptomyces longispororuber TaxID=68230 RepID=UPI00340597CD